MHPPYAGTSACSTSRWHQKGARQTCSDVSFYDRRPWIDTTSAQDKTLITGTLHVPVAVVEKAVATSILWFAFSSIRLRLEQFPHDSEITNVIYSGAFHGHWNQTITVARGSWLQRPSQYAAPRRYIAQTISAAYSIYIVSTRSDPAISAILLACSDMTACIERPSLDQGSVR
jgi:hypothetical protein